MESSTAAVPSAESSYASDLRRRAGELAELAVSIERSLVMSLVESEPDDSPGGPPGPTDLGRLYETMLQRNLHQLHRAADDLRDTALRFRRRADELDAASRDVA